MQQDSRQQELLKIPAFMRKARLKPSPKAYRFPDLREYKKSTTKSVRKKRVKSKRVRSGCVRSVRVRPGDLARGRLSGRRKLLSQQSILTFTSPVNGSVVTGSEPKSYEGVVRIVPIGKITHYFDRIRVGAVELSERLSLGERIQVECIDGFFEQVVESMQLNREDIKIGRPGDEVGIRMPLEPLVGGKIYRKIE